MKIILVTAELFHADERTDVAKLTVAFRKFCERAYKFLINGKPVTKVNQGCTNYPKS